MRFVSNLTAVLACLTLAPAAMAFDVQTSGAGPSSGGSVNLAPETVAPGVSIDHDLRAQLGIAEQSAATSKSGLQFGTAVYGRGPAASSNPTALGYDDQPWVAPRTRPGH